MAFPSFQHNVAQFTKQHNLEIRVGDRMLDLTSEVGELAKEILKASDYGQLVFQPNEAWKDELGDVFFSLICLANSSNTNLVDALNDALDKYRERLKNSGNASSEMA